MGGIRGRRPQLTRFYRGQFPITVRPHMRAVRRGVGITLARAFREGA